MKSTEIFNKTINSNYLIIDEDELKTILDNYEIILIEDTHLSDFIRILRYDNNIFIQEITFKKESERLIQSKMQISLLRIDWIFMIVNGMAAVVRLINMNDLLCHHELRFSGVK